MDAGFAFVFVEIVIGPNDDRAGGGGDGRGRAFIDAIGGSADANFLGKIAFLLGFEGLKSLFFNLAITCLMGVIQGFFELTSRLGGDGLAFEIAGQLLDFGVQFL